MLKRYTKNIYFDFYINAAQKLGIRYKILAPFETTGIFYLGENKLYISYGLLGVNSEIAASFAKNKYKCYRLLDTKNFPYPKAKLIKENETIEKIIKSVRNIPSPWVVKPLKGMGGAGVSTNIKKTQELEDAIKFARRYKENIIIEEFIEGSHYRILIFKNKIIDILARIPANITGDEIHTIRELIDIKNKKRKGIGLKSIKIDQELIRNLKENGLTLKSKIKKNKTVFLRKNCNMSTGGETERIKLSQVAKDNLALFINSVKLLSLNFAGIDFITPDISQSYEKIKCALNEINRAPGLDAHYFADMEMNNFVAEEILKMYFNS